MACDLTVAESDKGDYECLVVVFTGIGEGHFIRSASKYLAPLTIQLAFDQSVATELSFQVLSAQFSQIPRVIYSPIPPLTDYSDVRSYYSASKKGVERALQTGARKILLFVPSLSQNYEHAELVSILGALEALYVPLEVREALPDKAVKIKNLGISNFINANPEHILRVASAIETGRIVCRDIGGSDPERMAAPRVAEYVTKLFEGTSIKVNVMNDENLITKEFPLLAAVNRAARGILRHRACVIFLTYEPPSPIDTTLIFVGKGVTYDTGGADIKIDGHMAGMHRDKCGAAAIAGFFEVLNKLKPTGIKVLGAMAMVRNSIGADSYVSDEIITSRAGVRVRVGNTDAEGRMAMGDVLCFMKEKSLEEVNPLIFTIATLTGHACLAVGQGYSIIMENGPAKLQNVGEILQKAGDSVGDMFEISTIRPEDFSFIKGKSEYEDLLQCNNEPSSRTPRGHQFPAAFLIAVSGLDQHGINSVNPIVYSHVDIAASEGEFPGIPFGVPIAALTSCFLFHRV